MAQDRPSPESNLNQQPYTPTTVSRTNSAALFSKCWQSPQTGKSVKKNMVSETHPVPGQSISGDVGMHSANSSEAVHISASCPHPNITSFRRTREGADRFWICLHIEREQQQQSFTEQHRVARTREYAARYVTEVSNKPTALLQWQRLLTQERIKRMHV